MLNLDSRTRSKLVWVATLLAPAVVVQGVRFLAPAGGPAAASAAPVHQAALAAAVPAEPEKPLTPAQAKAQAWLRENLGLIEVRSPMDRPDPEVVHSEKPPEPKGPAPAAAPSGAPQTPTRFALSGMIVGGEGRTALACINHKVYRVGDQVGSSWRIRSIDARKRLVVLAGPEGRMVELRTPSSLGE